MTSATRGALACLTVSTLACGGGGPLARFTPARAPHEAYAESLRNAGLASHAIGEAWFAAADRALSSPQVITLPFRESGYLDPAAPSAVAYRFDLPRGRAVAIDVTWATSRPAKLFVDLFRVTESGADRVAHAEAGATSLTHVSRREGAYVLRLQPELLGGGRYSIIQRSDASLRFPVEGASVRNIQSIFGDARDGGQRDHHGVDIFAPRGTPVVAGADGTIRSVNTTEIGGRVIWLADASVGQSLYYAHLDDWNVRNGQQVMAGDVIGYVGNTGNARTTPPHLHFGIYSGGPVDPMPFIRDPDAAPPSPSGPLVGAWARVARGATPLREAGDPAAASTAVLPASTAVRVLAVTGARYRVALPDGREGYVDTRALAPLEPARTRRLEASTSLLETPSPESVVIRPLAAGTAVAVLAAFDGFSLIELAGPGGRRGWVRAQRTGS